MDTNYPLSLDHMGQTKELEVHGPAKESSPPADRLGQCTEALSQREKEALMNAIDNANSAIDLRDVCTIMINTGVRVSELRELHWDDINLDQRHLLIVSKIKHARKVPFNSMVLSILVARLNRQHESEYVFGDRRHLLFTKANRQLRELSAHTHQAVISLNTLRRTFMMDWIRSGGSPLLLAIITGYSTFSSGFTSRLSPDQLFNCAAQFQKQLEG